MIYTFDAKVMCADTHLFQAYGLDQSKHLSEYQKIENHWIEFSAMYNVPSAIARAIYWNRKKEKKTAIIGRRCLTISNLVIV